MFFGNKTKEEPEEPKATLFEKELKALRIKSHEMHLEIDTLVGTVIECQDLFSPFYILCPSSYSLDKKRVFFFKKAYRGKTMNSELAFYCSLELQKMIDGLQESIEKKKQFLKEKPSFESLYKLKDDILKVYDRSIGGEPLDKIIDYFEEYLKINSPASNYKDKVSSRVGYIIGDLKKEKESIVFINDHVEDLKSFKHFVDVLIKK